MATRLTDWMNRAGRDLLHARHAMDDGDHEWACFAAHQAAEKAAKALYQGRGAQVVFGHSLRDLLEGLPAPLDAPEGLLAAAKVLDRHYIPSRYPDAFPSGAPFEYYTLEEAAQAIDYANAILGFCKDRLS